MIDLKLYSEELCRHLDEFAEGRFSHTCLCIPLENLGVLCVVDIHDLSFMKDGKLSCQPSSEWAEKVGETLSGYKGQWILVDNRMVCLKTDSPDNFAVGVLIDPPLLYGKKYDIAWWDGIGIIQEASLSEDNGFSLDELPEELKRRSEMTDIDD